MQNDNPDADARTPASPKLVVDGVTKIFGSDPDAALQMLRDGRTRSEILSDTGMTVAVNDAGFTVGEGEIFVIMGPSGSGKSTLVRMINRLIEPTAGEITIDGESVTGADDETLRRMRLTKVAMVFQHFALFPHRTVRENVEFGLKTQGVEAGARRDRALTALEQVGLRDWAEQPPSALSGGMQQRVGLARGLATQARVLLMDEPFSALDPLIRVNMQQELMRIQNELGRTILFITHDLDEAMRIGNHIAIMDAGKIVQIGTPEEILVNPQTEYVANFVEHADPTGVLRAGTIALPFASERLERVREHDGIEYFARPGDPRIEFGIDGRQRLHEMRVDGHPVQVLALDEVLDGSDAGSRARRGDLGLVCREDTVLRTILRGRVHATLPTVVTDGDGRVFGIVDEPELINGILEKRGYAGTSS